MLDEAKIQRAHDLIKHTLFNEDPNIGVVCDPVNLIALKVAYDCLCWVLEHKDNPSFEENITDLEADYFGKGIIFDDSQTS